MKVYFSNKVADSAIEYSKRKGADNIICGHTHQHIYKKDYHIEYFNSGCWTDLPSTFITIDKDGSVNLNEFIELRDFKSAS